MNIIMAPLRRIKITKLNEHVICVLCSGYYVEATTIIECLHTFCKTCIVRYLQTSSFCPVCEVQVHKTKPLLSLREDKTLQDVVYKIVPGLFHNEMSRRVHFYHEHPEAGGDRTEQSLKERRHFFHVDDQISLSLEFLPPAYAHAHALGLRPLRGPSLFMIQSKPPQTDGGSERSHASDAEDNEEEKFQVPYRRYLHCPAAVQIRHLEKFIRLKYGLSSSHRVDIVHGGDCLSPELTLLDVVYMYKYTEEGPLCLQYTVIAPPVPLRKRTRCIPRRANVQSKEEDLPEPSSKKFKIETPCDTDELPAVTDKPLSEEAEEADESKESAKLTNSLDSSRDDGDDAMVIDESASDSATEQNSETDESKDKESVACLAVKETVSSQVLQNEPSTFKPVYTSAKSCEQPACSKAGNSLESLKALVNSSPNYPNMFPNAASPSTSSESSSKEISVNKTTLTASSPASSKSDTKVTIVPPADITPKSTQNSLIIPSVSHEIPNTKVALPPLEKSADKDKSIAHSIGLNKAPTAVVTAPTIVPSNSAIAAPTLPPVLSTTASSVTPLIEPTPKISSASVVPETSDTFSTSNVFPNGTQVSGINPQNTTNFPTTSFSNPASKSFCMQPPIPHTDVYRPQAPIPNLVRIKNAPPQPSPRPVDPTRPRLGRPPNKLRAMASKMSPRIVPQPSIRKMAQHRASRPGIYSQQRKLPIPDKAPQPRGRLPAPQSPNLNPVATGSPLPQSLMDVFSPLMNQSVYRKTPQELHNTMVAAAAAAQTPKNNILNDTLMPTSMLATPPFFPNMNGVFTPEMKGIMAANAVINDKINGFSGSTLSMNESTPALQVDTAATSSSTTLPNQSFAATRPTTSQQAPKGSAKSPGRVKPYSNSTSILDIAQSLANKQLQQKSLTSTSTPSITPSPITTAPTTVPPINLGAAVANVVDNPLAAQLSVGLGLPHINPAFANYMQTLISAQINARNNALQECQRRPDSTPIDLSPTSKSAPNSASSINSATKPPPTVSKYVPISPKTTSALTPKPTASVPLKIPNASMTGKPTTTPRSIAPNSVKTTTGSTTKTISGLTTSRCTSVTSLATSRSVASPLSISAASPLSIRSPTTTSVPSPKPAQSPSPSSPSTPSTAPTISPPTPEVTITKLPNSSNSQSSQVSISSTPSTQPSPAVNATSAAATAVAASKLSHTNTVSITKRPSTVTTNGTKFSMTRSPSNASVRQIPNPSLLSHQSEVRNSASKVPNRATNINGHAGNKNSPVNPLNNNNNNNNNKIVRVDS